MKTQHDSSVTQAVSGDVTAAATDRPTCVAGGHRADPPAEAVAVIEPPKPDDLPVAAGSDEIRRLEGEKRFILMSIRKALGIEHDEGIGFVPTIEKLRGQLNEWAQFGAVYGVATPQEMFDAIQRRNFTINEQNENIAKLEDENSDLLLKLLEVKAGGDHSADAVDMVNNPPHYQGKVECIDAIESALGPEGFVAFCRGNAMKYIFRAGRKGDEAEDLAKAGWYLRRAAA